MTRRPRTSTAVRLRARELRRQMTPAESLLWSRLRNRQLMGLKFRRQHPLGALIADFYCPEYRLVVEIDGGNHDAQRKQDEERTRQIEAFGYRVLRFRNERVINEIDAVLLEIAAACGPHPSPALPSP